jgi:hypothetical protein
MQIKLFQEGTFPQVGYLPSTVLRQIPRYTEFTRKNITAMGEKREKNKEFVKSAHFINQSEESINI